MSKRQTSPLETYNSLKDKHLAGYFSSTRIRRHLRRMGLIGPHAVPLQGHLIERQDAMGPLVRDVIQKKHVRKQHLPSPNKPPNLPAPPPFTARTRATRVLAQLSHDNAPQATPRPITAPVLQDGTEHLLHSSQCVPAHRILTISKPDRMKVGQQLLLSGQNCMLQPHPPSSSCNFNLPLIGYQEYPNDGIVQPQPPESQKRRPGPQHGLINKPGRTLREAVGMFPTPKTASSMAATHKTSQTPSFTEVGITLAYLGKGVKASLGSASTGDHVKILQLHSKGESTTLYQGTLIRGEHFSFTSQRQKGYQLALSIFVSGVPVARVRTCCELGLKQSEWLGGQKGHFRVERVDGAAPCYRCFLNIKAQMECKPATMGARSATGHERANVFRQPGGKEESLQRKDHHRERFKSQPPSMNYSHEVTKDDSQTKGNNILQHPNGNREMESRTTSDFDDAEESHGKGTDKAETKTKSNDNVKDSKECGGEHVAEADQATYSAVSSEGNTKQWKNIEASETGTLSNEEEHDISNRTRGGFEDEFVEEKPGINDTEFQQSVKDLAKVPEDQPKVQMTKQQVESNASDTISEIEFSDSKDSLNIKTNEVEDKNTIQLHQNHKLENIMKVQTVDNVEGLSLEKAFGTTSEQMIKSEVRQEVNEIAGDKCDVLESDIKKTLILQKEEMDSIKSMSNLAQTEVNNSFDKSNMEEKLEYVYEKEPKDLDEITQAVTAVCESTTEEVKAEKNNTAEFLSDKTTTFKDTLDESSKSEYGQQENLTSYNQQTSANRNYFTSAITSKFASHDEEGSIEAKGVANSIVEEANIIRVDDYPVEAQHSVDDVHEKEYCLDNDFHSDSSSSLDQPGNNNVHTQSDIVMAVNANQYRYPINSKKDSLEKKVNDSKCIDNQVDSSCNETDDGEDNNNTEFPGHSSCNRCSNDASNETCRCDGMHTISKRLKLFDSKEHQGICDDVNNDSGKKSEHSVENKIPERDEWLKENDPWDDRVICAEDGKMERQNTFVLAKTKENCDKGRKEKTADNGEDTEEGATIEEES